eukprot:CAMPEP_0194446690 /NCGR_PEP_ID=MMETSP0176-20130528/128584_1 /TAXON_ID=216777 /ORGANISM="Proboscia alata, Strain PI-D3" /LENGTH=230 /DNA_ID=CAMNT_0039273443 /DNA_START=43 /DNA_END=735 /DNA_ORIENTATION=+
MSFVDTNQNSKVELKILPRASSPNVNRDDISLGDRGNNDTIYTAHESVPGAFSIAGINDGLTENRNRNNVRPIIEGRIVHDATHVNDAHAVEPVIFVSAEPPSFLQNKNKRNCVFGIVLITSFVCIVWSIAGYMNPSIPFQIIEPENLIPKSMNLDNIAMQIRGVVSGNNPLTTSLWINATDEHIKDFYAANEDFGISVTKIETVFLEDLFTEQEDTGVIEIRYSDKRTH